MRGELSNFFNRPGAAAFTVVPSICSEDRSPPLTLTPLARHSSGPGRSSARLARCGGSSARGSSNGLSKAVPAGPRPLPGDDLSTRERQVARLAVDGLTAREIGEQLFISPRTVETHLASVYAKLGVRSKVELTRRASELALNQ